MIFASSGTPVLVDDGDWRAAFFYNWTESRHADGRAYFRSFIRGEGHVDLHRWLLKAKPGTVVDHVNGDTFDCRRKNLRVTVQRRNAQNSCMKKTNSVGLKGVQEKPSGRFSARIRDDNGARHYLGTFETSEEAHAAYTAAAHKYHGEFARV